MHREFLIPCFLLSRMLAWGLYAPNDSRLHIFLSPSPFLLPSVTYTSVIPLSHFVTAPLAKPGGQLMVLVRGAATPLSQNTPQSAS